MSKLSGGVTELGGGVGVVTGGVGAPTHGAFVLNADIFPIQLQAVAGGATEELAGGVVGVVFQIKAFVVAFAHAFTPLAVAEIFAGSSGAFPARFAVAFAWISWSVAISYDKTGNKFGLMMVCTPCLITSESFIFAIYALYSFHFWSYSIFHSLACSGCSRIA